MKRKMTMLLCIGLLGVSIAGCSFETDATQNTQIVEEDTQDSFGGNNNYTYFGDALFLPIAKQSGRQRLGYLFYYPESISFIEYVKVSDQTIWIAYHTSSMEGASFEQEFAPDGTPVLYDGDIEALKKQYGVSSEG